MRERRLSVSPQIAKPNLQLDVPNMIPYIITSMYIAIVFHCTTSEGDSKTLERDCGLWSTGTSSIDFYFHLSSLCIFFIFLDKISFSRITSVHALEASEEGEMTPRTGLIAWLSSIFLELKFQDIRSMFNFMKMIVFFSWGISVGKNPNSLNLIG